MAGEAKAAFNSFSKLTVFVNLFNAGLRQSPFETTCCLGKSVGSDYEFTVFYRCIDQGTIGHDRY